MLTLEKALDLWLSEVRLSLSKTSLTNYEGFAKSFLHSVGHHRKLVLIDYPDALTWCEMKSETRNANSMRTMIVVAKVFFNWCVDHGYLDNNPFDKMPLPKAIDRGDERAITDEDRDKLLTYTYHTSTRNFAIVMFLASTLCRLSACASLTVDNLDLMNRQAIVWEKGRRLVTVTFNRNTAIALNNYLQERNAINPDHNYVWLQTRSATFDPLSNSGIAAMLKATSIRAGCSKHVTAHSFRHAGAQFWSRNPDVSPVDTQNKLNHLHFKATQIYYAKNSFRVGTITDDHDILPTDISARLNGEESGIMPKNLIKFPRG